MKSAMGAIGALFCQRRWKAFTNILYPESAASDRMAATHRDFRFMSVVTLKSL